MGGPQFGGPMGGPGGPGMEMLIERFDVNEDGSITREEVTAVTAEKMKTFDLNGDGALSLDEYKALWTDAMNEAIVRSFQFHDPDGDAKVTLEEYSDNFDKLFARFDRNGDGTIAADEFGPPRGGDRPDGPPPGMGPGGPDDGPDGEGPEDNG
jgi:Ca2+-binding EF-hand superfamily protein